MNFSPDFLACNTPFMIFLSIPSLFFSYINSTSNFRCPLLLWGKPGSRNLWRTISSFDLHNTSFILLGLHKFCQTFQGSSTILFLPLQCHSCPRQSSPLLDCHNYHKRYITNGVVHTPHDIVHSWWKTWLTGFDRSTSTHILVYLHCS